MLYNLLFNPHTFEFLEGVLGSSTLAMVTVLMLGLAGCAIVYTVDTAMTKFKRRSSQK